MLKTFPQSIRQTAKKYPNHDAFRCGTESVSYAELDKKTDQLAAHLLSEGVGKGDRIGIYMNRCLETAIAIYGIMKAGAVYVPLDTTLPLARTAFLLNDCGIKHLVSIPKLKGKHQRLLRHQTPLKSVIGSSAKLAVATCSWEGVFNGSVEGLEKVEISSDDLAYIMYTSGSTGYPKGIMHTHSSGLSYAELSVNQFDLTSTDVLGNHAPLHFDISTLGYFAGPLAGATTIVITDAHTKMPASLAKLIESEKITVWYSVPLALVQMLQGGILDQLDLDALRLVLFGGEVFTNKYLSQLMKLLPKADFYNIYGPAEVNQCTCYLVQSPPGENEVLPIGKVWDKTGYMILDKNDQKVQQGEVGELLIHSATRMRGYWNNSELTNKSFYSDRDSSEKLIYFRTGDLVRENEKGELLFIGRNDRQIKIRGYRIEIDEIEACIAQNNEIDEAAVIILEKSGNEKEIRAVVKQVEGSSITEKDLLNFCKMRLPVYAVPKTIEFLNSFPRTGSGKIDRNRITDTILNRQNG